MQSTTCLSRMTDRGAVSIRLRKAVRQNARYGKLAHHDRRLGRQQGTRKGPLPVAAGINCHHHADRASLVETADHVSEAGIGLPSFIGIARVLRAAGNVALL